MGFLPLEMGLFWFINITEFLHRLIFEVIFLFVIWMLFCPPQSSNWQNNVLWKPPLSGVGQQRSHTTQQRFLNGFNIYGCRFRILKWFKNTLLIPLYVIDFQFFTIFSSHNYGYASLKLLQLDCQAQTNHFNTCF